MSRSSNNPKLSDAIPGSEEAPLPFARKQHYQRLRRQTQCDVNDTQNVLFILDKSGSISSPVFRDMTAAISKLPRFFCRQVRIAVMTFDHTYNIEFCFDCFDNTCSDRITAGNRINGIPYTSGNTHSGGATQCACNVLLHEKCGLPVGTDRCITVVYLTDGQSNGPKQVCTEVKCLHNRKGVEVFAIGIGKYQNFLSELQCIAHSTNSNSIFKYQSFAEFVAAIDEIEDRLTSEEEDYECLYPADPSITNQFRCT